MVSGKNKVLQFRRKRRDLTNYNVRLGLLKSGKPRMVVRKTSQYFIVQLVEYNPTGDKVLVSITSKSLLSKGWNFSCKNLPAAYLTGFIFGKECLKKSKSAVLDLGNLVSKKEAGIYAVVKGAIDAGMDVPVSEEILPSEERISGKHISEYGKNVDKEKYKKLFSGYLKSKVAPEKISEEFEKIKSKL